MISEALFKLQGTMCLKPKKLPAKALLIIATCMRSFTYCTVARRLSVLMRASVFLRNARG